MSRKALPKYCHHKGSGQAFVRIDGKNLYLGVYGSPDSHRKYAGEISRWQSQQLTAPPNLTVGELTLLFMEHAKGYYVKNGEPSGHLHVVRNALKQLNADYRSLLAVELGPKTLVALRNRLIKKNYSRKYINDLVAVVKRMYRWGAAEEMVPVTTYQALLTIGVLTKGRSGARETEPVGPVPMEFIRAVEPFVLPPIWGAIQFQLLTGARPSEALSVRACDLNMTGEVWTYTPARHKTEHHGRGRVICIGPACQRLLRGFLTVDLTAYVFGTKWSQRKLPYRRDSYTASVAKACRAASIVYRKEAQFRGEDLSSLKEFPIWSPNQLRHTFATLARREFGIEAARVTLGHSSAITTEVYAQKDLDAARAIAAKIG